MLFSKFTSIAEFEKVISRLFVKYVFVEFSKLEKLKQNLNYQSNRP